MVIDMKHLERIATECDFSFTLIRSIDQLKEMKEKWNYLAQTQACYMPFLCFEWYSLWLEHFLKDDELCVMILMKEEEPVFIAPFIKRKENEKGVKIRKIELIGNVYSPFRYFIINQSDEDQYVRYFSILFETLARKYKNWHVLEFQAVPEERNYFSLLKRATQEAHLTYYEDLSFGDWYMDGIDVSGDEYFDGLPKKIKKDVLYCKRRLSKMGDLEFKVIKEKDMIESYMDCYYEFRCWFKNA